MRAQSAARALEVKHGLEVLESSKGERATRGYSPAEQARVEERSALFAQRKYEAHAEKIGGDVTPWHQLDARDRQTRITTEIRLNAPRNDLARKVRASASASENEAEFVRRLRRSGVVVRPRYADGQTDVITGYSVAAKPAPGSVPFGTAAVTWAATSPCRDCAPSGPTARQVPWTPRPNGTQPSGTNGPSPRT